MAFTRQPLAFGRSTSPLPVPLLRPSYAFVTLIRNCTHSVRSGDGLPATADGRAPKCHQVHLGPDEQHSRAKMCDLAPEQYEDHSAKPPDFFVHDQDESKSPTVKNSISNPPMLYT